MDLSFEEPDFPDIKLEHLDSLTKLTTIDLVGGIYCNICHLTFPNKKQYDSHYTSHETDASEIVYTCVVCLKQFPDYRSFRGHCYLKHLMKDRFKCEHCDKTYSKHCVLVSHIKTTHTFECTSCVKKFSTKTELRLHLSMHKGVQKPPYNCNACGNSIDTADMCEQHIDENSTITFPCPICDEIMPTKAGAMKHVATHFNVTSTEVDEIDGNAEELQYTENSTIDMLGIQCCHCNTIFKNRIEIELHFIEEHSDKEFVFTCTICKKKCEKNKYSAFLDHCYSHLSRNKFECTECDKTFPRLSLFIIHTENYHYGPNGNEYTTYECQHCEHTFNQQRSLMRHLQDVHSVNCIMCPESGCNMSFESLKSLIKHQREHKTVPKNSCRHCGLQFPSLASCENHIEVHRKKVYSCPACKKEYREKYLLVKHIPSHFEMVLHICKTCGKSFNARNRLIEHNKIHSRERTHTCTYCGKGFFKSCDLDQHVNIHTGMKPFKCTVCPKTFASYPNWAKHVRRMHSIDIRKQKDMKAIAQATDNNKSDKRPLDLGIDSTSSEISAGTCSIMESDDSTMDSIDPITLEKEMQIINSNINLKSLNADSFDLFPPNQAELVGPEPEISTAQPTTYPLELGPDFVNTGSEDCPSGELINLDDHILPYINPLLTINYENGTNEHNSYEQHNTNIDTNVDLSNNIFNDNNLNMEPPVYTRVYPQYSYHDVLTESNLFTVMDTDIF